MKIVEIFTSIMGEVNIYGQGAFATFVRLGGCNLNCPFCDTNWKTYEEIPARKVALKIFNSGCNNVLITGGEPLLQVEELNELIKILVRNHYNVMIETNGTIDTSILTLNRKVRCFIVDYKLPSSGIKNPPRDSIFTNLRTNDYIKFVISDWDEYLIAVRKVLSWWHKDPFLPNIAFAPMHDKMPAGELMRHLRDDKLYDIILNTQLHKYINVK